MSKKRRISEIVSVDGDAFKNARLAFKNQDISLQRGEYGYGSQEWLAEQARVSPRTISELETGRASLKTVDAVSHILSIKGREFVYGYGADCTKFRVTSLVDFRPIISGRLPGNEAAYLEVPFLVTLIHVAINIDDDFIESAALKNMQLTLAVGDIEIKFRWLYKVGLNSRATTWLGDEEEIDDIITIHNGELYQSSIMFKQDSIETINWKQFIEYIKRTKDNRILLTLSLIFEHFEKSDNIIVSVDDLMRLFESRYPPGFPYWVQPKALMV